MKVYKSHWDSISIGISALCVVHCIVLPIFLSTLPLWGIEVLENSYIELFTILCTIIAGGWAIGKGFIKYHHHSIVIALFIPGIILMILPNYIAGELLEMILKGCGAVFIFSAHIINWKKCKTCCRL